MSTSSTSTSTSTGTSISSTSTGWRVRRWRSGGVEGKWRLAISGRVDSRQGEGWQELL